MTTALATTDQPNLAIVPTDVSVGAMEAAIGMGDFSRLNSNDRLKYVAAICQSVGLNPLTKPFDYITLQGKLTLYANKGCAEQLRKINGVTVEILERRHENGVYSVRVRATDKNGRSDESLGVVPLADQAKGDMLANAMMKAETKAKRRVTLSICGLGMIDESEVDSVPKGRVQIEPSEASDTAAALNAEIVDVSPANDPRNELLGQIQGALTSAVPGTDSESKRAKADWLQKAFGCRSWIVVEALPVEKLREGLDKLTALLVQDPVAEPVPAPVLTKPVLKPTPKPVEVAPEPESDPFSEPEPAKPQWPVLDDDTIGKVQEVIGEHGNLAMAWLKKQTPPWLVDGQGFHHLAPDKAKKIIAGASRFLNVIGVK